MSPHLAVYCGRGPELPYSLTFPNRQHHLQRWERGRQDLLENWRLPESWTPGVNLTACYWILVAIFHLSSQPKPCESYFSFPALNSHSSLQLATPEFSWYPGYEAWERHERERRGRLLTEGSYTVSIPDIPSCPRSSSGTPVLSTGLLFFKLLHFIYLGFIGSSLLQVGLF